MPPSILHLLFPSSSLSSYLIQTPETSSPLKCERCRKNTHSQHTHRHTTKEGGKLGRDCLTWRWTPEQTRRESKIGETEKKKRKEEERRADKGESDSLCSSVWHWLQASERISKDVFFFFLFFFNPSKHLLWKKTKTQNYRVFNQNVKS